MAEREVSQAADPLAPVVGVTGKYCAGKSTVAAALTARGFAELDADSLTHVALQEHRDQVVALFGEQVLTADGQLDRRALGARVFRDADKREQLEQLLHPLVARAIEEQVATRQTPVTVNAVYLVRAGLHRLCDAVLWVAAPWWKRLARALRRDRVSVGRALRVMKAQRGLRRRDARADSRGFTVIRAGRGLRALDRQVGAVVASLWRGQEQGE